MLDFERDKTDLIPLYLQVAKWMEERINSGYWKKGEKLLPEKELSESMGVSRGTLRQGIKLLVEKDLLVQIHGKGTYVTEKKISYPFAQNLVSFAEAMEAKGYSYSTEVIKKSIITVDDINLQKQLDITSTEQVLYLERIRKIKNAPAIILKNWVPLKIVPGIENVDFEKTSLFKGIEEKTSTKISYGIRSFSACSLNAIESSYLELPEGEPALLITQTTFTSDEDPIEFSEIILRTDKYDVTSVLTR